MALMSRDGALPPMAFQLLIYPATDMTMTTVSSQTTSPSGVPLTSATMKWFIDHYYARKDDAKRLARLADARRQTCRAPRRRWC